MRGPVCRMLLTALFSTQLLSGCSPQTRHELLTFFFTGVPPLESPKQATDSKTMETTKGNGRPLQNTVAGKPQQQLPQYFSHPIWLEGNCSACHQGSNQFSFSQTPPASKSSAVRVFFSGGGMPGNLLESKDKLCLSCHTDKTGIRAIKDGLWLHNTTARGDCLACHDPHQSKNRAHLRKPPEAICSSCHPKEKLAGIAAHASDKTCLTCHNPHMGKDRRLLSDDFSETKTPAKQAR